MPRLIVHGFTIPLDGYDTGERQVDMAWKHV
jgi:hypothetical protein